MSRATIIIQREEDRQRAARWAAKAPIGCSIEFKEARRSTAQNAKMHAMLTEVARQVKWHGVRLRADDYKLLFLDALKRETRIVPNLEGDGFVNLNRSSRDLTKGEFADLLTLIEMFGANHGVHFNDGVDADVLDSTESDAIDRTVSA